ncbi:MAG: hypothetical protein WC326_01300 [Candidatus Delongbacteria bacterium]
MFEPESLLIAAALLGALWLVRRGLTEPSPVAVRADGKRDCGGCAGCDLAARCERTPR